MKLAFYIFVGYALLGFIYYPSEYSFFSFCLVLFYSIPLLIAGNLTQDKIFSNYSNVKPLLYWGIVFLGFVNLGIIANNVGVSIFDALTLDGVKSIALQSTIRRYEEDTFANSGNPILLALTLWLIFRIGTNEKSTKRYLQLIAFFPLLMYTLLTTEKWPSFLGVIFYITGIVISNDKNIYRKILKTKIKYGIGLVFLMILSLSFRGENEGGLKASLNTVFHYVLAQYNSLGYWFLELRNNDLSFGKMTFIGPLNIFGIVERNAGVFSKSLVLYGKESNIYTAFRYFIQDFGVFAPFFINFILSVFYIKSFKYKQFNFNNLMKVLIIFTALLSMNTTPFVHNSVIFGLVLCMISDYYSKKRISHYE